MKTPGHSDLRTALCDLAQVPGKTMSGCDVSVKTNVNFSCAYVPMAGLGGLQNVTSVFSAPSSLASLSPASQHQAEVYAQFP